MVKALDLTGHTYGRLTVKEYVGQSETKGGAKKRNWLCDCSCGKELVVTVSALRSGNTTSCGCYDKERRIKHGLHQSRIYQIWADMKTRCNCSDHKSYRRYGGRGISYDTRWESFENFLEDMQEGYREDLTLDRIDPNDNYYKENCRWETKTAQTRNKGMNSRNKTGVTGVHVWFDGKNGSKYYVSSVKGLDGKMQSKHFSVNKYGEELAFFAACEYRELLIEKLNLAGAGYSEYHGKGMEGK